MICGKFREEMWEKRKKFGEFLSNLCLGLVRRVELRAG